MGTEIMNRSDQKKQGDQETNGKWDGSSWQGMNTLENNSKQLTFMSPEKKNDM